MYMYHIYLFIYLFIYIDKYISRIYNIYSYTHWHTSILPLLTKQLEHFKVTAWKYRKRRDGTVPNGSKQSVYGRCGTVQNGSVAEFVAERFRTIQNGSGTNCSLPRLTRKSTLERF